MGWEQRNGNFYYYRKRREGGRVVSDYCGAGELAGLLAQFDAVDRFQKRKESEKERETRARFERVDILLDEFERQIKDAVKHFLIERGFYKTSGRQWRLRGDYDKEKD